MAKKSRDKGKRIERLLVQELARLGWGAASREGWKQVRGGGAEAPDVQARPPGWGTYMTFECKGHAKGFDAYYQLLTCRSPVLAVTDGVTGCVLSANIQDMLTTHSVRYVHLREFEPKVQRTLKRVLKLQDLWLGEAHILALKQDRKPFLYARFWK